MVSLLALFIGIVAGLRAMMPLAAVSWAAYGGFLDLSGTWIAFLGTIWAAMLLTVVALLELVTDQLPNTPSRKVPQQFITRLLTGALAGAAIGVPYGTWIAGLVSGVLGAVAGTYGGAWLRATLATSFGKDPPAAFIEDAIAIVAAVVIIMLLPGTPTV